MTEKIVKLCVCVNGDNPPPDCPCVICTVRRAEARIKGLEDRVVAAVNQAEAWEKAAAEEETRAQQAEARLEAVKALHKPYEDWGSRWCSDCGQVWPCPTYQAAEGKP